MKPFWCKSALYGEKLVWHSQSSFLSKNAECHYAKCHIAEYRYTNT